MLWVSSNRDPHLIIVVSASHIPTPNPLTHTVQFSLLSPIFTSIDRLGDSLQFHRLKLSWCSRLNPSRYLGVVPTAELFCFTFIGALHAESTYPFCFLSSACLLMDKTGHAEDARLAALCNRLGRLWSEQEVDVWDEEVPAENLVIVKPWVPNTPLHCYDFTTCAFWVQVFGLPRKLHSIRLSYSLLHLIALISNQHTWRSAQNNTLIALQHQSRKLKSLLFLHWAQIITRSY